MSGNVYLLMLAENPLSPDVIYSRDSELKIGIYPIDSIPYEAHDDEIQLYGYLGETLLVFETIHITADEALEVLTAIKWYTGYIGCPDMEILPDDPRTDNSLALAL